VPEAGAVCELVEKGSAMSTPVVTVEGIPFLRGNSAVIADFQAFFSDPNVEVLPLTAVVCEPAAQIRAASLFKLKVPDCLHLATAIEHGCGLFLTNDDQLRQSTQIPVEILT
jgi:uncharacterized protein